ncbi:glycerol-3-phosphate phosphatase-like [Pecten maximus]|uniref:glycerol-3-phosphate phosphatase-like n=1 Tax=Pecten maximus TaxID=6579 RepID=UPI00145906B1|nr:glycerol-3-phosphate phosphatase-like [Pecten maximus]
MGVISKSTKVLLQQSKRLFISSSLPFSSSRSNMACHPITELSARQILDDVDNFVFDCDGVLWDGLTAIEGSPETLKRLKKLGKKVYYITNNSTNTRKRYMEKCEKLLGFPVTEDEVLCTAYAAALYLHNRKHQGKVYVVGNKAMGEELDEFGINHTGIGPDVVGNKSLLTDFASTELDPEVNCVLVGFDPDLSLNKMVKGASYARKERSLFLATNEDSHLPLRSNVTIPGTGSIVAAVKVPARREPIVIGKPNPTIFNVLKEAHGLDPSRTLMVGDRCNTDIALAKNCGLHSLLVLSGVMSQEDVDKDKVSTDPQITQNLPDHVAKCLWEFGKHIPDSL